MKAKLIAGAAVLLLASTTALAGKTVQKSDTSTVSVLGAFTQTFSWTTSNAYNSLLGSLYVSGLATNFSDLKLTITDPNGSGSVTYDDILVGGSGTTTRVATFNDSSVAWNLASQQTVTVTITGVSLVSGSQLNLTGSYFKADTQGPVTAVPEPESYAMLLAGLGLMGTIARRRSKKAS